MGEAHKYNTHMNRTREIADTPEKGQKRYQLYKSAIDRYQKALKEGFYLEAITLMESLITDRLESILIYHGIIRPEEAFRMLGPCITELQKVQGVLSDDLLVQLNNWRKDRNKSLHEIAKIEEGDPAIFNQRYSSLQQVAKDGYKLFQSIKKETR